MNFFVPSASIHIHSDQSVAPVEDFAALALNRNDTPTGSAVCEISNSTIFIPETISLMGFSSCAHRLVGTFDVTQLRQPSHFGATTHSETGGHLA